MRGGNLQTTSRVSYTAKLSENLFDGVSRMLKRTFLGAFALVLVISSAAVCQRPRAVTEDTSQPAAGPTTPPPSTIKAKYEGGVFGYPNKKDGTIALESMNNRLVFRDSKQKELFSIPFGSITGAYSDTHKVQPAAATAASHVPLYGIPASFVKTKVRYLTVQYDDPDSKAAGITSFRLENKEILDSVLNALATSAGLTKRGEIYVRKKE